MEFRLRLYLVHRARRPVCGKHAKRTIPFGSENVALDRPNGLGAERLIERNGDKTAPTLAVYSAAFSAPIKQFALPPTLPVRYRWSRNGGRMVTSVVLAQKVELRGGRSCIPRSENVAKQA